MSQELLTRDALTKRNGGVWDYISPSRLNTWLACPLKFKLKYIDGVRAPSSPAAFVGKAVHSGLEHFYRHRQLGLNLTPDQVANRLADDWDQIVIGEGMQFIETGEEQLCQQQTLNLVLAYLKQVPPDEPRPMAVEAAVEAPLVDPVTGEDLGMPLVGIMDLVLPDPDGAVIVDFKTTTRSGGPLEVAHEIQLGCYAYLFRHASGAQEGALEIRNIIKTKVPKVQTHRYAARNDKHFTRLFAVIRAYLDDLHSDRFVFRPGLGCSTCDFRGPCAAVAVNSGCYRGPDRRQGAPAPGRPHYSLENRNAIS